MANLTSAPNLNNRPHKPYEDLIVLAGRNANKAWGKGKGEEWLLLCKAIWEDPKNNPVILDRYQLEKIDSIRIVEEDQELVKIVQCGELTEAEKTAICRNLAKNSNAAEVSLLTPAGEVLEDLSLPIKDIRNNKAKMEFSKVVAPEKVKEKSGTNKKARAITSSLGMDLALHELEDQIYVYDGIIWKPISKKQIKDLILEYYEENDFSYSARTLDSVFDTIKAQLPMMDNQADELIAFKNGTFNRNTLTFSAHLRENWLVSYIPHDYFHVAQPTPLFDDWLDWVSDSNQEKASAIMAGLYMILTNRNNWQLFLEITGDGGSGKSVFAQLATMLAGSQNTCSSRLTNLDEPRGRENIIGKTLIICPEQPRYGGDGSGLKGISGGDLLDIDPKHKKAYNAIIRAIVLIINNEATRFTERSGGIERRRVIFHFNRIIPEEKNDPNFTNKIESEISGIIYKLIHTFENPEAAKQLLKAQAKSQEALEIKMQSDHITEFCSYFYTTKENNGLWVGNGNMFGKERESLYPAYLSFCEAIGIKNQLTLNNFSTSLKQGLAQHKNPFPYFAERSTGGRKRSNVHFKNHSEFAADYARIS